jgi:ribosomal protein L11 methyltransferase
VLKRFNLNLPGEYEEMFIGLADRLGVSAFINPVIEDYGEGETDYRLTGLSKASFIVSTIEQNPEEIEAQLDEWLRLMNLKTEITCEEYSEDQDWMTGFREHFRPIILADSSVVIRPPWISPLPEEDDAIALVIDPGMAFGTGTHETTRLCIELMKSLDVNGDFFLDMGAGSGILSFYLMKRKASAGIAVELEGAAVENMRKNAALNGISDRLKIVCSDIASFKPEVKADGLVANITTPVIMQNLALFSDWVKSGAWGVFSGVNSTNAEKVKNAFIELEWIIKKEIVEGDWHGFLVEKK